MGHWYLSFSVLKVPLRGRSRAGLEAQGLRTRPHPLPPEVIIYESTEGPDRPAY